MTCSSSPPNKLGSGGKVFNPSGVAKRNSCGSFGDNVLSLIFRKEDSAGHIRSKSSSEELSSRCDAFGLFFYWRNQEQMSDSLKGVASWPWTDRVFGHTSGEHYRPDREYFMSHDKSLCLFWRAGWAAFLHTCLASHSVRPGT